MGQIPHSFVLDQRWLPLGQRKMRVGSAASHALIGSSRVRSFGWVGNVAWTGDASGEFRESFLDNARIASLAGVQTAINLPTRDGSSPLLEVAGTNSATWDYQKLYTGVIYKDSIWNLLYSAGEVSGSIDNDRACYATSNDGVTWSKPTVGAVTYSGNMNNNIVFTGRLTSVNYYSDIDLWVATSERTGAGDLGIFIYTSSDLTTGWTLVKTISPGGTYEGKSLVRRDDGRWIAYIVSGHNEDMRHVDAWLSTTTDIAGSYSSVGAVMTASAITDQRYSLGVYRTGDVYYGLGMRYNSTSGTMRIDLYVSRDGLVWSMVDNDWLAIGANGAFDDEMIWGPSIVEVGNTWWIYYAGSPVVHNAARPKDMRIGRASIPKGRIGQVSGTGTVTTVPFLPTSGQTLSLNCDAVGGIVEVEVLDSGGQPVTGHSQVDAVDITTDTYSMEPSWSGGLHLPTGSTISLRFHLTDATIFGYQIS